MTTNLCLYPTKAMSIALWKVAPIFIKGQLSFAKYWTNIAEGGWCTKNFNGRWFSGYNQIAMHPDDREKTTFTTPWGTFMSDKMPFGLMNVGATFQRAMDIAFVGERNNFVVIYLDNIIVFSQSDDEQLKHLKQTFLKSR